MATLILKINPSKNCVFLDRTVIEEAVPEILIFVLLDMEICRLFSSDLLQVKLSASIKISQLPENGGEIPKLNFVKNTKRAIAG